MSKYILPTDEWVYSLKVGDPVCMVITPEIGGEPRFFNTKIKSITPTRIMKVEGNSAYTFKDGYRRGFQYKGNCWLQPIQQK